MPHYIGVISDTHGCADLVRAAADIMREFKVIRVLHCGDIGTREIINILSEFETDYVFGNCDSMLTMTLTDHIEQKGGTLHGWFGHVELDGKKIAFLHGYDENRIQQELFSGNWDMICHGHTHRHLLENYRLPEEKRSPERDSTILLNPGAIKARYEPPQFCIVKIPDFEINLIPLTR